MENDGEVVLYHQSGCPQCSMVEMILEKRGISHSKCDDIERMRSLGITHTPTLSVGGELLTGKPMMEWISKH